MTSAASPTASAPRCWRNSSIDDEGQLLTQSLHGLPAADRARSAADQDRRSLHAVAADDVRPEGLGRSRLSRRARRDRERDQRCGARRSASASNACRSASRPRSATPSPPRNRRTAKNESMIIDSHAHLVPPSAARGRFAAMPAQFPSVRLIEQARLAGVRVRRRQADAAGVQAADATSPAGSPGWTRTASTGRWSAAGSTCSATSCRRAKARAGRG